MKWFVQALADFHCRICHKDYEDTILSDKHPRINREQKTVETMVADYCQTKHKSQNDLCPECSELLRYAMSRLERCPYQEGKTTCAKCPVHCYKPEMREKIREVMRFSGPRMIFRHPIMALLHMKDGLRKKPVKPLPISKF